MNWFASTRPTPYLRSSASMFTRASVVKVWNSSGYMKKGRRFCCGVSARERPARPSVVPRSPPKSIAGAADLSFREIHEKDFAALDRFPRVEGAFGNREDAGNEAVVVSLLVALGSGSVLGSIGDDGTVGRGTPKDKAHRSFIQRVLDYPDNKLSLPPN